MRKIGIITLNGYVNYGNRLQNYALQKTLESFNLSVETVLVDFAELDNNKPKTNYMTFRRWLSAVKRKIKRNKYHEKKIKKFKEFTKNYIHETDYAISESNLHDDLEKFDFFITGSDQVWNPYYNAGSSIFFLEFAPKEKRLSYAPSISVNDIPSEYSEKYKKWLEDMSSLSIRENEGARVIKKLTGRDATVVVDPTLLLTKQEWLELSKEADNKPKNNFLLTYFLGGVPEQFKQQISNLAKEKNLEIVNLADINERETYTADPSEFLDYINSCSLFCTDSFHGAAFSILFEKPFIIYERQGSESMYSRINTILGTFKLDSRKSSKIKTVSDAFSVDYSHVPDILRSEREKARAYISSALNS